MVRINHRLIIRHPSQPAILLVSEAGRVGLPAFDSDDRHTAEVDYINQAVGDRFGLRTTVLRSLGHSEPLAEVVIRTHELEAHGDGAPLPSGMRWCPRSDLPTVAGGDDADVIGEWLTAGVTPRAAIDGREWTLPGWFDEACDWLARALADAGAGEVDEIVQLRSWPFSCVLRVHTGRGTFYFKAVPESIGRERTVTEYLARHFPPAVARVVAANPERRWFLMSALAGKKLEDVGDVTTWELAVTVYGQMQLACVERVSDLRALGCPTRGLDALAAEIEGLSGSLHGRGPELRRRCERLAACGIPLTLEHGDLWPGNFLVDAASCAIIDWEDVAIGHPFFSLAPLLVGLHMFQPRLASPEVTERLERAYVSCFARLASLECLREALRLAGSLGFVDMAVRYRHQRPSIVRLHPWMRDLVPQVLGFALARLDSEEA